MTQLEMARMGKVAPEMEIVAAQEELPPGYIRSGESAILTARSALGDSQGVRRRYAEYSILLEKETW